MSNMNGNSTPYFENLTSALLFCWIQKHNICKIQIYLIILFKHINILYNCITIYKNIATNAYNDLADILHHPKFEAKDVVKNIRKFRQKRKQLPLMPIRIRTIRINQKKTPSTSKETKPCYYLSICDIL